MTTDQKVVGSTPAERAPHVYYLVHMESRGSELRARVSQTALKPHPFCVGLVGHLAIYWLAAGIVPFGPFLKHDNILFELPRQVLMAREFQWGNFVLWDPFTFAGAPFHGVFTSSGLGVFALVFTLSGPMTVERLGIEAMCAGVFAYVGIYHLLWRSEVWTRVIAALTVSASSFMIFQTTLNMEGAFTTAAIPWILLGATRIMEDDRRGVFTFALGIAVATTSGYLGLNVLLFYPLTVFLILEVVLNRKSRMGQILVRLILAGTLGLFPATFGFIESVANGQLTGYFSRGIEVFASISPMSSRTILIPVNANSFDLAPDGTQMVPLFIPAGILIGFGSVGLRRLWRQVTPYVGALLMAILISVKLPMIFTKLREHIPFVEDVRYRSWLGGCLLIFIVAIAATGLRGSIISDSRKDWLVALFAVAQGTSTMFVSGYKIHSMALLTVIFAYWILRRSNFKFVVLLGLTCSQIILGHLSLDRTNPSLNEVRTTRIVGQLIKQTQGKNAVAAPQTRVLDGRTLGIPNTHYYSQTASVFGYFPQVMPPIARIVESGKSEILEHFVVKEPGLVVEGRVNAFRANSFKFEVNDASIRQQSVTVTFPYSPNFKIWVNDLEKQPHQSKEGLLRIDDVSNGDMLTVRYEPPYAVLFKIFIPMTWFILVVGTLRSLRRLPYEDKLNSKSMRN